jgi:hypothetical protein
VAFDDVQFVAEDGRAVAVFTAEEKRRSALADALSWHVNRRFQSGELEADTVIELRMAGALADRIDEFRGVDGRAPLRLDASQVRVLIDAIASYVSERDVEGYQPPEERERIAELSALIDPLFDLALELDRADGVLSAQSL